MNTNRSFANTLFVLGLAVLMLTFACLAMFETVQADENLPFVTFHKWREFTERQQEIYIQALLETWSFTWYSWSGRQESPAEFSAFTACAETEKTSNFRTVVFTGYYILGEIDKPVVAHIFEKKVNYL